jgi:glycosyltransferase involved in cell wall biosynthesis
MNARAIMELSERVGEHDLILLTTGTQRLILNAFPYPQRICCEWTVGYRGIVTGFCAFESSSFMHEVYAREGIENGRDFDAVIPNFFDPLEFPRTNEGDGDYLLFVGRMTLRKGPAVAAEVAAATGMRLLLAGPGVTSFEPGRIEADHIVIEGDHCEYLGEIGIEERSELMAGAHALLAPTSFLEPFGGVAVEAQMCGTPAITTDHGAFRETVAPEFRFRNLAQAIAAVEAAGEVDHVELRRRTNERFSLDAVAPMYEEWFDRLSSLWGLGWYELPAEMRDKIPVVRA